MIEVIFAVYKQWGRIEQIMWDLQNQTIDNFRVSIWNNSGHELSFRFPRKRLFVFNSPKNVGTGDRWQLVKKTTGSPIIVFDDDEKLAPDFIEYYYKEFQKWGDKCVLGWYTKLLGGKRYKDELGFCLPYGTEVDYMGGGGSVRSRKLFEVEPRLVDDDFYRKYNHADDFWHSYLARKHGFKLISIEPRCKVLSSYIDNKRYKGQKEQAFQELRKEGWKMLCEGF